MLITLEITRIFSKLNDFWNILSIVKMLVSIYLFLYSLAAKGSEMLENYVDKVRKNIIFHIK